ncbi:hypothetical protein [Stenotrophomonas geniculata]|uniref:hypothetical protein n=1 Tax=Stenotrophomonas geniculata TaxID=86188 RepID=UPI000AC0F7DC|nr:hypothetical protein [Stenotrophomonas geniculata]
MAATVSHQFSGVFLLDEGQLRRINDIIAKRLPEVADGACEIHVSRADSFSFVTGSIDEVCSEENGSSVEIERIRFVASSSGFSLRLDASREDGVNLGIEGNDRDAVFLIYSELKAYIDQGVMSRRWLGENPYQWKLVALVVALGATCAGAFGLLAWSNDPAPAELALKSNDVLVKLNYLIDRGRNVLGPMTLMFCAFIIAMIGIMLDWHAKALSFFFPANVFMLGRMVRWYESRVKLRSQIFWSVIVAAALGVATSAFFAK